MAWRGESLLKDTLVDIICRDSRIKGNQRIELLNQLMEDQVLAQIVMKFNLLTLFPTATLSPADLEMKDLSRLLKALIGTLTLDIGRENTASIVELMHADELETIKTLI